VTSSTAKKSDLGVRTLSAIVMLAVAGGALWLGGIWLQVLIVLAALAVLVEFVLLISGITVNRTFRIVAMLAGLIYVSVAGITLLWLDVYGLLHIIGAVILVDVFAYFFGRMIGGPKIAPAISPSKTWAGLLGGIVGAAIFGAAFPLAWWDGGLCEAFLGIGSGGPAAFAFDGPCSLGIGPLPYHFGSALIFGMLVAVIAQTGDFFESWLKRKAGVKDSSNLIPGHGGIFDRVDGLLAVAFIWGSLSFGMQVFQ
jgi:phosphatidate cytidylyltransferase